MSKTSSKSKYYQLMEWLQTINQPKLKKEQSQTTFSKANYYKSQGVK